MRKIANSELNRMDLEGFQKRDRLPVTIVLDNVRSGLNIGSVFRTADAFAIEKILLCGIASIPPHREIEKTALGATESMHWVYYNNTREAIGVLIHEGYLIAGIEQLFGAIKLTEFKPASNTKLAFVFGNEINGLSEDILELLNVGIEIPQFGTKHSFNISVTVGIVLWHYYLNTMK